MNNALIKEYYLKLLAKYSLAPTVILILLLSITSITYDRFVTKETIQNTLSRNSSLADQITGSFTHSTGIIAKSSFSSIALKFGDFTGYRSVVVPWISEDKTIQGIIMFDKEHKPVLTWPSDLTNNINPSWIKSAGGIQTLGNKLIISHDIFDNTDRLGSLAFLTDSAALGLDQLNIQQVMSKNCTPVQTAPNLFVCAGDIGNQKILFSIITILISVLGLLIVFFFSISRLASFLSSPVNALHSGLTQMKDGKPVHWKKMFDPASDPIFRPIGERFTQSLTQLNELNSSLTYKNRLSDMAKKLAHDIRSPLSALNIVAQSSEANSDSAKQLMASAIKRINEICLELLKTAKTEMHGNQKIEMTEISKAVEEIVIEKKIQHANSSNLRLNFKNDIGSSHVFINENEFKCAISNLINNAVEAVQENGSVNVRIKAGSSGKALIEIADDGMGIPPQILATLCKAPISSGKENSTSGSGIGVYNASKLFHEAQGSLLFDSVLGQGTRVRIELPFADYHEHRPT